MIAELVQVRIGHTSIAAKQSQASHFAQIGPCPTASIRLVRLKKPNIAMVRIFRPPGLTKSDQATTEHLIFGNYSRGLVALIAAKPVRCSVDILSAHVSEP